jgi:putative transposase
VIIMNEDFQRRSHSVGQNAFHLVWCPKYRWNVLKPKPINALCEALIRGTCYHNGYTVYELEVMPDHIHLFVELPPRVSVSAAFHRIKGRTSRILRSKFGWLRKMYPRGHMWSPGKFYRSVGSVTADTIQNYIKYSQHDWQDVKPGTSKTFPKGEQQRISAFG